MKKRYTQIDGRSYLIAFDDPAVYGPYDKAPDR